MNPAKFEYHAPSTLQEAVSLLREHEGDAKVLGGGQSLIPAMRFRLVQPDHLIDLKRIHGLSYVRRRDGKIAIGAMTTYRAIETSALLQRSAPIFAETIDVLADVQVRNKGTIGGALAHADPAADLPAVVTAMEATVRVVGGRRSRSIPAHRFFQDAYTTVLGDTEVISEILVDPLPRRTGSSYQKFANKASRFAIVGVAAVVTLDAKGICTRVRISVTGAGPTAARARRAERMLEGNPPTEAAIEAAAVRAGQGIEFLADLHGSAAYRADLTCVLTSRALVQAISRANPGS